MKCNSVQELMRFIQTFSQVYWGVPENSPLTSIFAMAASQKNNFDRSKAKSLTQQIEEALYAEKPANLEVLRSDTADLFFQKQRNSTSEKRRDSLAELNPS